MVNGFTKFKERFQGFENQYVIIGGTACDLIMENEELPFRATKDVDIVLIVESITEFGCFQRIAHSVIHIERADKQISCRNRHSCYLAEESGTACH